MRPLPPLSEDAGFRGRGLRSRCSLSEDAEPLDHGCDAFPPCPRARGSDAAGAVPLAFVRGRGSWSPQVAIASACARRCWFWQPRVRSPPLLSGDGCFGGRGSCIYGADRNQCRNEPCIHRRRPGSPPLPSAGPADRGRRVRCPATGMPPLIISIRGWMTPWKALPKRRLRDLARGLGPIPLRPMFWRPGTRPHPPGLPPKGPAAARRPEKRPARVRGRPWCAPEGACPAGSPEGVPCTPPRPPKLLRHRSQSPKAMGCPVSRPPL